MYCRTVKCQLPTNTHSYIHTLSRYHILRHTQSFKQRFQTQTQTHTHTHTHTHTQTYHITPRPVSDLDSQTPLNRISATRPTFRQKCYCTGEKCFDSSGRNNTSAV